MGTQAAMMFHGAVPANPTGITIVAGLSETCGMTPWNSQATAGWTNPGGLTAVKVKYYRSAVLQTTHTLAASATTDDGPIQSEGGSSITLKVGVIFSNAFGDSNEVQSSNLVETQIC